MNFKDKKILITGATGGIGNAIVKKFIELEGTVFATGTKKDKLEELKITKKSIFKKKVRLKKSKFLKF